MASTKIAIRLDAEMLSNLDRLVAEQVFASRSQAVQVAIREKLERLQPHRLARECDKLDPEMEQQFAEEGLAEDFESWPAW